MAKEIFMPKLSSTMEVGTLLQWFKEEGDPVEIGEPLFEIMTDKINIEVESYDDGVLLKKYFDVDQEIPVNQIIGYIGEESEEVPAESPGISSDDSSGEGSKATTEGTDNSAPVEEKQLVSTEKVRATPAARRVAREKKIALTLVTGSGPNGRIHEKDVKHMSENKAAAVKMTPLARKIAQSEQVDVSKITGTGKNGKIVKDDLVNPRRGQNAVAETNQSNRKKLSGMRKVIADRMQKSVTTAPHVTLTSDIDMTKVKELRGQLLPTIEKQTGYRLSFTEVIIKAAGMVLSRYPSVNASIINDEIVMNEQINIGLAVALEDGLMVPVLKDVNKKGLSTLTSEAKDIGKRARELKLLPDEMKGSTFTISNLGMYAIDTFTPIINLPETAILGVGRIQDKPVVINQEIVIRPMMAVSLSFDHRAIDGAPAAAFLTELKHVLENPFELLV
ncbi:dihydrolipoamide acetyltransferase family protein [Metabacillus sp. Hm71]|uniref:dihydrolipoamide acetyltransferase family protein n=1 Tax=Metabacillus sp. Hm71 TaxID=3450743 RepID=UPI003F423537